MKNDDKHAEDFRLENAKIENIGLYYCGHDNSTYVNIILRGRGWGASITMPENKVGKFVKMFDDEVDVDNGIFLHELKGKPVRVMFDGQGLLSGSIIGIGDILSNEDDMILLKT